MEPVQLGAQETQPEQPAAEAARREAELAELGEAARRVQPGVLGALPFVVQAQVVRHCSPLAVIAAVLLADEH